MIVLSLQDIVDKFEDGAEISLETLSANGVVKNAKFITKYSDEKLRAIKGRKATKEYLYENVESYVKEKDYTSILKIIGNTEVNKKFTVKANKVSKTAKEMIEKAGGKVEIVEIKSYSSIAGNNENNKEKK